jgi:hypothetical protein
MTERSFAPTSEQQVLGTLARLFARDGRVLEVAVLAQADSLFELTSQDRNWNIDSYGWTLQLKLPLHVYAQIEPERESCEKSILRRGKEIFRSFDNDWLEAVFMTMVLTDADDWKDKAKAWLAGSEVNNQGRVRSGNIAPRSLDGLLFRSQAEMHLYGALKNCGVAFAPLPVFIRGGEKYRRIEPDFILIKDGVVLHVEVDGDTVHQETPFEAHQRTAMLHDEGVHVERLNATQCDSPDKAKAAAAQLLKIIEKRKTLR